MSHVCKRAFMREEIQLRIRYTEPKKENFTEAMMYNSSEGGLYFETRYALSPGQEILIHLVDRQTYAPEKPDQFRARVMWCRQTERDGADAYGVGVRFFITICDQCESEVLPKEIHPTDLGIFLCSACMQRLMRMSEGHMKEGIKKYLLGNVI